MDVPLIVLLDLDGTVLGDVTPQVVLYEILDACKRQNVPCKVAMPDLTSRLTTGIVRPYFHKFFQDCQKQGVEFFVYTASEKRWAEFIVKQIEKAYSIKINRPIFTRNQCVFIDKDYIKSIQTVRGSILRTLNRKYQGKWKDHDLKNKVLIVDNRPVYTQPDLKFMLQCETYNMAVPENLPLLFPPSVFQACASVLFPILQKYYGKAIRPTQNYREFEHQFYSMYLPQLQQAMRPSQDKFFRRLRKLFILLDQKNIHQFTDKVVTYMVRRMGTCLTAPPA